MDKEDEEEEEDYVRLSLMSKLITLGTSLLCQIQYFLKANS